MFEFSKGLLVTNFSHCTFVVPCKLMGVENIVYYELVYEC
jgi:hypothetical protein